MIKKKGTFQVSEGSILGDVLSVVKELKQGSYNYLIYDDRKNRNLPQLKYLFGVVLKTISEAMHDHPTVDALYRYYEEKFAPQHICTINGSKFAYRDLKNEKTIEVDDVIDKIVNHATNLLEIHIPTREEVRDAEAKELYVDAYAEMWKNVFNQQQNQK